MNSVIAIAGLVIKEIFRKKDFYVAFIFTAGVLFFSARIRFYNAANAYRYLLDIGLGLGVSLAVVLTTALCARQFPTEVQQRTCQVLLSKPVSRAHFILGKFIGCFAAGCTCLGLFFSVILIFAFSRSANISAAVAAQTFYFFCLSLGVLTALSIFLSFFMTTGANVSVSLTLYFLMSVYGITLHRSASAMPAASRWLLEALTVVVPHFGFFDMRQRFIHGWSAAPLSLTVLLTAYAFCYSGALLLGAWFIFRKKNIL